MKLTPTEILEKFVREHGPCVELLSRMDPRRTDTTGWFVFEDGASFQKHPNGPVLHLPPTNRDPKLKVQGEYHSEHVKRAENEIKYLAKEITEQEAWAAKYRSPRPSQAAYDHLAELQSTLSQHQSKLSQIETERASESND